MKQSTHFRPSDYSPWFRAKTVSPDRQGWYECQGWRFNGYLHLYWNGEEWLYFGPPQKRADFPSFGKHKTDEWRGLNSPDYRNNKGFNVLDITGQKFGMLTAIAEQYRTRHGSFWMFRCNCGSLRVAQQKWVTSGNTASCGCLRVGGKTQPNVSRPWRR